MANMKSSFIFATHLHEIVNYEEITSLKTVTQKHLTVVYDKERDALIYDRKLKEGPGQNMYGLEVCKSLLMPEDFLRNAKHIQNKYFNNLGSNTDGILGLSISSYNQKKIRNICEKCHRTIGTEIHHKNHQKNANDSGYIKNENSLFHKNALHNLMSVCELCHKQFHT